MPAPSAPAPPADLRCHCGSLMARITSRGIELKCRRCKRVVMIATERARTHWVPVLHHGGGRMAR